MKKRVLACVLTVLTATSALVGCGGKQSAVDKDGKVTVKVLSRYSSDQGPDDIVFNKRIEEFMEANPDIIVEHEAIGDEATYNNMFKTAIATGDSPDLFVNYGGTQFKEYIENGLFLNLEEVGAENKEWEDKYIKSMFDAWKFEGIDGYYGVPMSCFATGIYYNKDLFKENGIEAPKTIEEFEKACDTFISKGIVPFALGDKDNFRGAHLLANLALKRADFQYTKDIVDGKVKWDDPVMKEIFTLMSDWQKKGYFGENVTTMDTSAEQALFLNGTTPMHLNGSWFTNQVKNDAEKPESIGFVPFPYFEKYPEFKGNWHSGTSEGISLAATNGPERLEASKKLLVYLTDKDAYNQSQEIAKGGIFPVTTMEDLADITPICKEFNEMFVDVTDTKLEPGDYAANPQLREDIRDSIQGMFAGTSVEDTLARIQKTTDMK